jgi:ribonucleotide monophosphatase NagD (HAD superfamily)
MDVELSEIYMIGDNPASDIQGANVVGWKSILVESGVYQPDNEEHREEQASNPLRRATHIVKDFDAAIDLIYKEAGLPPPVLN